jgi:spermidine synthase
VAPVASGQRGGWHRWRDVLARVRGGTLRDPVGLALREARLRRHGDFVSLQFTRGQTQSRMLADDPDHLLIDYTRTMLAALLWQPRPACIGMVGLGGGSQAKFCYRHLPGSRIEVVENHPGVIALRRDFGIPDDDARLRVELDDGARFVRARRDRFDLLLVDGYDPRGIPEALSTQDFYDGCRAALADGGVMAGNLFCADPAPHVERLERSFGSERVLVLEEAKMSNRVAFAWVGRAPAGDDASVERAHCALSTQALRELGPSIERVAGALRRRPPAT